jgi:L,D-peptidoglycan transpeptidase YkuD (ErfK/YbiS/YcfS/YnhG family)
MSRVVVLLACVCACLSAGALDSRAGPAACTDAFPNGLQSTGSSAQLVTVVAATRTSTRGAVRLWRRSGECWVRAGGPWLAWLGGRGVSANRHEGDRTTPAGVFGFGSVMYGVAPNPGVRYPYHRIVCGDWWVEDARSPYYNRFHHVPCGTRPPFRVTDQDMSRSPTAYRHFAFIGFNTDPVIPGRGSGIFLHASTGRPTLGCVALALPNLLTVLRSLRPELEPLIAVGTADQLARF